MICTALTIFDCYQLQDEVESSLCSLVSEPQTSFLHFHYLSSAGVRGSHEQFVLLSTQVSAEERIPVSREIYAARKVNGAPNTKCVVDNLQGNSLKVLLKHCPVHCCSKAILTNIHLFQK